ncbi:MAG: C4-dicarboxylate ABC transporter permease [Rhodospirillaceae bacterium]|jgi:putative tricarboxylic transport membrane protein|nr:C4-dicarboxylate ABC transporter permease [Rhodospirillaceae bacterium]MBT5034747.1 C4-dicarboxylate ABC transporter permease [Rhodospirillaceae bacterium]MBT6218936.1 C4-dicarboxylate ABC transporter permease [Rhodospirillaceae bacterium]MBT6363239.1 C4-dicarboxylate ABC transporter permease [Rhodospirillaceae bacterium]
MLEGLAAALPGLLDGQLIGLIFMGVAIGMLGGALPGISPSITIALLLPIAFSLDPLTSLVALGGVYMAAEYGGSISAILINTPGTAAAVCTALDGHPMARQGRAQEALHAAILASSVGGLVGVLVLIGFTPPLAELSLKFKSPEMFWLAIAGLAIVCNLTAANFVKGVMSALIGMFIATIGYELETGYPRFAYDIPEIEAGISLVPCIIGFFAIPQMLMLAGAKDQTVAEVLPTPGSFKRVSLFMWQRPVLVLRSAIIGTFIGILPGAGASIASFVSYSEAKRFSKEPEKFGTGIPEGVIASECANNAMVGGSLIPLLAFGIPGSASAAVLFGALTLHGLSPGGRLFTEHASVVYGFMVGFIPVVVAMLIVGGLAAPVFAAVLRVRTAYIVPTVMMLALIGTYSFQNSVVDIFIAASTGVLGFFMMKFGFSLPSVVLGIILAPMAEEGFRRSLLLGTIDGSVWGVFFSSPICIILILIVIGMVVSAFVSEAKGRKRLSQSASGH